MLDAVDEVRILCAEREERLGVTGINTIIERWFGARGAGPEVRENLVDHRRLGNARYKPELQRCYYNPARYRTYLEQLGVRYPTVREQPRPNRDGQQDR